MGDDRPVPLDHSGLDDNAADNDAVHGRRRRRHPLFRGRRGVGGAGMCRGGPDAVGGLLRVEYLDNLF